MVLRGILAILDHNANLGRECVGESLKYSKSQNDWVLRKKYKSKETAWRDELMSKIMRLEIYEERVFYDVRLPKNIAPVAKPTMEEMKQRPRYSRFYKM